MKLEVGKYYKARDGRKVGPMERGDGIPGFDWDASGDNGTSQFYDDCGVADDGRGYDLISEWSCTPTTGTLAELCVKPGDVVEFVEERDNPYGYTYPTGPVTVLDRGIVIGIRPELDDAIWRIVSRASDLSKLDYTPINVEKPIYETEHDTRPLGHFQSGPVITETVTRIVPGVYGHIWIDWVVDGIVCLGLRNNALKKMDTVALSRADLIAARDNLSQLIDAMPSE